MASSGGKTTFAKYACQIFCLTSQKISYASPCGPYRQYDLRDNSKHSDVLIDLTEFCGQLVEAKCLAVNPRDNNYLAVGANGPFVRLYDIRMIHNYRLSCVKNRTLKYMRLLVRFFFLTLVIFVLFVLFYVCRKSVSQSTSAAVHTFCEKQKPIPDGAGQYYVAGACTAELSGVKDIKY